MTYYGGMAQFHPSSLLNSLDDLDRLALEPDRWTTAIDQLAQEMSSRGGTVLSIGMAGELPTSEGAARMMDTYWRDGWHEHDFRRRGIPILDRGRAAIDEDLLNHDEYRQSPLTRGLLLDNDLPWWCSVGFQDGRSHYVLSLFRSSQQGSFTRADAARLESVSARLSDVATLARLSEQKAIGTLTDALGHMMVGAVAIDATGQVTGHNERFDQLVDSDMRISARRLRLKDVQAAREYEAACVTLRRRAGAEIFEPIVIRRENSPSLLLKIIPLSSMTGTCFGAARALLIVKTIEVGRGVPMDRIMRAFSLTRSEARLASVLMAGLTVKEAADEIGISNNTARVHLRAHPGSSDS